MRSRFGIVGRLIAFLCVFSGILHLNAAFLENHAISVSNPDGSKIDCYVTGDEFARIVHDKQGYSLLRHPRTGFVVYAISEGGEVVPSEYRAGTIDPSSLGIQPYLFQAKPGLREAIEEETRLRMEYRTSPLGQLNSLVIMICFNDQLSMPSYHTYGYYHDMFNLETGPSLNHYYSEVSNNQLNIDSHLFPTASLSSDPNWLMIDQPRNYFSPYNEVTNPIGYINTEGDNQGAIRKRELFEFAVDFLDTVVPDGLDLDTDNDGAVDGVTVIVRGGADDWGDVLWPCFSSNSSPFGTINGLPVHRVVLNIEGMTTTSVVCHEMGHQIGAPDFYHYTEQEPWASIQPTHRWEMMSNNCGHWLTYNKKKYGHWFSEFPEAVLTPTPTTYTLTAVDTSPYACLKIASSEPNQYYMLEYRRQSGLYETAIPGSGLIVYRIIEGLWGNAGGPPDEVYVFRPNDDVDQNGNPLQAFLSSQSGRTSIIRGSNHDPWLWADTLSVLPGNLVVSNVGASGGDQISFDLSLYTADGNYWTGTNGTSWHNPSNWSMNTVPTPSDNVVIPAGLASYPQLIEDNGTCYDINIENGARISLGSHTLFVYNDVEVYGTISYNNPSGILMIAGDLILRNQSSLLRTIGGGVIVLEGSLVVEADSDVELPGLSLTFQGDTSSVITNHNSNMQLGLIQFNKASGASVVVSADCSAGFEIANDFWVPSGQSFVCQSSQSIAFLGNILDSNTSAYRGFKFNDGTAVMAGENQSVTFSSTNSYFNDLDVQSSVALSLLSNIKVRGNLSTDGKLVIGPHNLSIEGQSHFGGELEMNHSSSLITAQDDVFWDSGAVFTSMHNDAFFLCQRNMSFGPGSIVRLNQGTISFYGPIGSYIKTYASNTELNNFVSNKTSPNATAFHSDSSSALTINGNLTNTANSKLNNFYDGLMILKGNFINENTSSPCITWDLGTLIMRGTDQIISMNNSQNCINNLRIDCLGQTSLTSQISIAGNFQVLMGSFNPGSYPVYVSGNWNVSPSADFVIDDSTIHFVGSGDQFVSGTEFNVLRLTKSTGNLIFNSGTTIVNSYKYDIGTLLVNGAQLYLDDLQDYSIQGNYVVQSGALFFAQDESSHLDLDCNLTISGGLVELSGGINQPIEWAYTRHTSITISDGTLDFGHHDILIADTGYNLNLNVTGGQIRSYGNISITRPNLHFAGGTFEIYGFSDCSISAASSTSFYDVKLNKMTNRSDGNLTRSNTLTLNGNLTITNDLILNTGYLSVNGYNLSVGRDMKTTGISGINMIPESSILQVGRDLSWSIDALCNLQSGYIFMGRNWSQHNMASVSYGPDQVSCFVGSDNSLISTGGSTLSFPNILIDKNEANVSFGSLIESLIVTGFVQVDEDSHLDLGTCSLEIATDFILHGTISGEAGASISCQNLNLSGSLTLDSDLSLYTNNLDLTGTLNLVSGVLSIDNQFIQSPGAILNINGGQFILDKPYTGAMFSVSGIINVNGGDFQITNNGLLLGPGSQLVHNAGALKIGWNFEVSSPGVFQPWQGTVEFMGNRHATIICSADNFFSSLSINKDAAVYNVMLQSDIQIMDNLDIHQGSLVLGGRTMYVGRDLNLMGGMLYADGPLDVINLGRDWNNSAGIQAFQEGSGTVNLVTSQIAIISSDIFNILNVNKVGSLGSTVWLAEEADLAVNEMLHIQNGKMQLNNDSSLAILGLLVISDSACLNLDRPGITPILRLHGNLIDQNAVQDATHGIYTGTNSQIIFAGDSDQQLAFGYPSVNLCKVLVQKTGGTVIPGSNIMCNDEFRITGGTWSAASPTLSREFQGDFIVESQGQYLPTDLATVFSGDDAEMMIGGQVQFGSVSISKNADQSLSLGGDTVLSGTTNINHSSGIFSLGGHSLQVQGSMLCTSTLLLPAGSTLDLLDGSTLNVNGGGKLSSSGTYEFPALITSSNGYYGCTIGNYGSMGGQYCTFEKMNASGIVFGMRSSLDSTDPPTHFTFRNGAEGGVLIRIAWLSINPESNTFFNAHFPENTWGGTYNVKMTTSAGFVRFENASGAFSGEAFEDDTYGTILWIYSAPPEIPQNLQIVVDTYAVHLAWDAVSDADAYNVYRSFSPDDPDSWEQVITTESTSYSDEILEFYNRAFYRVRAMRY